ncbi:hypothetical protein [Paenibacillus apiarius]|nr:hypothetical protein [Paenibacillus apiarius]MBN3522784.1 hypothetical protein [Paenibacillus apiarius]
MATKRKPPTIPTKANESINKNALYWVGGVLVLIVIIVSILLVMNG